MNKTYRYELRPSAAAAAGHAAGSPESICSGLRHLRAALPRVCPTTGSDRVKRELSLFVMPHATNVDQR